MSILVIWWAVGFSLIILLDMVGPRTWGSRTAWNDARYAAGSLVWPVFALWVLSKEAVTFDGDYDATPRGD